MLLSGVYSILLGSITPLGLLFNAPYYLGIQVGTDPEMTPRLPLSSVGYAYRAGMAEQALIQGFPVSPAFPSANQVLKFNGTNWIPAAVNLDTDTAGVLPISKVEFIAISQNPRNNTINALDSEGQVGKYTSTTIGTDGLPVISYYDATNGNLKVAHCGNAPCSFGNTITTVSSIGDVGHFTSIAIGTDGLPVISFYDATNGNLKVAHCGNAPCSSGNTITTVSSIGDVGHFTSIAIGTDGLPVISFYDATNGNLKVAHCGNAPCSSGNTVSTVDSAGDVGKYTSIAIGTDGLPVISYYDITNFQLKVAKCGNAACSAGNTEFIVDSLGNTGWHTAITIGLDGLPVIAYWEGGGADLWIAKCGDAACSAGNTLTKIDTDNAGYFNSISIGPDGLPIISYYAGSPNNCLKVAKCGNAACSAGNTITTVDSGGEVGQFTSITIGTDGLPVIAYYDVTNEDLKVAKCANPLCLNNWSRR